MKRSIFWLSFCDTDRPKGQQFLGAAMVQAQTLHEALRAGHAAGINPGGDVQALHFPDGNMFAGAAVPEKWMWRLLSKKDIEAYNAEQGELNMAAQKRASKAKVGDELGEAD